MTGNLGLKPFRLGFNAADGHSIAVAEFLDSGNEFERQQVGLIRNPPGNSRTPLVIEDEGLNIYLSELTVLVERRDIEGGLSLLGFLPGGGIGIVELDNVFQGCNLTGIRVLMPGDLKS